MRKIVALFIAMFTAVPSIANTYTVRFSNGTFGKYANYADGRIVEVCIHNVGYLMTDNGHLIVAVDRYNQPLICENKNEKAQPPTQNP